MKTTLEEHGYYVTALFEDIGRRKEKERLPFTLASLKTLRTQIAAFREEYGRHPGVTHRAHDFNEIVNELQEYFEGRIRLKSNDARKLVQRLRDEIPQALDEARERANSESSSA